VRMGGGRGASDACAGSVRNTCAEGGDGAEHISNIWRRCSTTTWFVLLKITCTCARPSDIEYEYPKP
jgi:hypothetical protein